MSSSSSSSESADSSASESEKDAKKRKLDAKDEKKAATPDVVALGSESDSDSESEDSSEDDKKKKKKKAKKDKKEKKDKKGGKKDKKDKKKSKKASKDKKDKKGKKEKKEKGKKGKKGDVKKAKKEAKKKGFAGSVSNQFGKYGVLKQEDFFNKKPEFLCWAAEVRKANTDALGQMQLKDLFKEYVEDYNTATMPSTKYYNLQVWDQQQAIKRQKKNKGDEMSEAQRASLASFDDEAARREEIKHVQAKKQEQAINDEVRKMRQNKDKVAEMKHQEMLRTQMDMLNKSGNTQKASQIAGRLDPGKDDLGRPLTPMNAVMQKLREERGK
mmetsp:Transcript_110480/g.236077  ORF Transcript_110480/g.236077 Transcript_110480/m.236077 type:complete len:328 (-) Transcript_110480:161-1144(-)